MHTAAFYVWLGRYGLDLRSGDEGDESAPWKTEILTNADRHELQGFRVTATAEMIRNHATPEQTELWLDTSHNDIPVT